MTDFDPVRAMREEVAGLLDLHKLIVTHARDTERKLAEAESDHNAFLKLEAFTRGVLDTARAKLRALEAKADADRG